MFVRWIAGCALIMACTVGCAAPHPRPHPLTALPAYPGSPYVDLDTITPGTIVHVPTGRSLTEAEAIDLAAKARVIYIGEMHTNLEHHRVQLAMIQALHKRFPGKIAVGMEMFQRPAQPQLDRWLNGKLDQKQFKKLWYDNWGESYEYYQPILDYLKAQRIPLVALNASDEQVKAVSKNGWEGLSKEERDWLGPIDEQDPYHRRAMQAVVGGHGHGGAENFERFYRTMLLWDETMAQSGAEFLRSPKGDGKKLVILAGGFHIGYGYGIPRRLFRRALEPYITILPETPDGDIPEHYRMDVMTPEFPLYLADVVWGTGYSEPEMKRVRLGVQLDQEQEAAVVVEVLPGSPAEKAGLKPGDRITSFNGEALQTSFDLVEQIRLLEPGDSAKLTLDRAGQTVEVTVKF